jgi:subtilisin-like proprotein convertase family protein
MRKSLLVICMAMLFANGFSQSIWDIADKARLDKAEKTERVSYPTKSTIFSLDLAALKASLEGAPQRGSFTGSSVIVPFPDGDGKIQHFRIYEASVLHPDLAAQHPDIKSYAGQCIEKPSSSIRFSITLFGLHAMMFSAGGTSYIDPYTKDGQYYISYKRENLKGPRNFGCLVNDEAHNDTAAERRPMSVNASDGILRTYRLAMACTVEYAAFHVNAAGLNDASTAEKRAAVLAAMNVTMTRVNGVYERDMAVTMEIIPSNESIIYITSDNLANDDSGTLLNQIQTVINNAIGFTNYDIGHVVSTGGGGVASLGSVCTSNKARGVTGSFAPVGDPFDIDYVAHEMGHQFGASHTFNNSFQRNASTAVEPGSGTTIMAYAGISPPNVQNNSDDYFHAVSIAQMETFINGAGGNCPVETPNGNNAPVIANIPNYTIPVATAFVLRGNATDADGDELTYCWEQTNANGSFTTQDEEPDPFNTSGPNFRSVPPSLSPNRYMPALESVLAGDLTPTWEVTSSVSRTFNFALTVRDNQTPNGGQTSRENINVTVSGNAGPFRVTSQNESGITWQGGSEQTITWDVAGTTANNVNTSNVNILLSTDAGLTFDTVLAANTPNDGSETITVPALSAPFCRIMVEGAGNIFYAVNDEPFSVGVEVTTICADYENVANAPIPDNATTYSASEIEITDEGLVQSVEVSVDITHTYIQDLALLIQSPAGTIIPLYFGNCGSQDNLIVTFSDEGSQINCTSPTTGIVLPIEQLAGFAGEEAEGTWTLLYGDGAQDDTGTLNSWSVNICRQGTAGTNEVSINDLTLYPNPNNGAFSVSFTPQSESKIAIAVYDMRGREIYQRQYENTGVFTTDVNVQGLQSGVYMVSVTDGSARAVRKIVIQ